MLRARVHVSSHGASLVGPSSALVGSDGTESITENITGYTHTHIHTYIPGIHTGGGETWDIPPQKHFTPKNPFSIDIIWHFPGGTCPQTPLGVESPPPPKPKILYKGLHTIKYYSIATAKVNSTQVVLYC